MCLVWSAACEGTVGWALLLSGFPACSAPMLLPTQTPCGGVGSERSKCEDGEAPFTVSKASGVAILRCSMQFLCVDRAVVSSELPFLSKQTCTLPGWLVPMYGVI